MSKMQSLLRYIGGAPASSAAAIPARVSLFGALAAALEAQDGEASVALMERMVEDSTMNENDRDGVFEHALAHLDRWATPGQLYRAAAIVANNVEQGNAAETLAFETLIATANTGVSYSFNDAMDNLRLVVRYADDNILRNKAVDKSIELVRKVDVSLLPQAFKELQYLARYLSEDTRGARVRETICQIAVRTYNINPELYDHVMEYLRDTTENPDMVDDLKEPGELKEKFDQAVDGFVEKAQPLTPAEFVDRLKPPQP